jgi:glycosyltransferase involved in cell wall biosynthesis
MKKILYFAKKPSIHDLRVVEALKARHQVTLIDNEEIGLKNKEPEFDILMASPLSINLNKKLQNSSQVLAFLSMGYDLNEELKVTSSKDTIITNLNRCDLVVIDNPKFKNILELDLKYKGEIYYLPYGCDIQKFRTIANPLTKIIGTNRASLPHYRNELILKAVARLQSSDYEKFVLVRHGEFFDELMNFNRHYLNQIKYDVIEGGRPDSTENFLRGIKFYISASKSDGSSVSMLEAMSAGKICIVSDHPCNTYWIENGINGFTFMNGSEIDLYQKLHKALNMNEEEIVDMSSLAKQRVQNEANWNSNSSDFVRFLEQY